MSCFALCVATVLDMGSTPVAARAQAPAHPQLQTAAVLTVISGDVQTRFGGSGFASATDGAVLYVGSTVRTSSDARAVITLFEGSTIELEPASDITIEEAVSRSGSTIVQLAQSLGRSWHVVTHLTTADSRYEVRTPAATASVRGTAFEVAVDDGLIGPSTTVTTTEGRVATADTGGSGEVLVAADQVTTVRANTAPEPPRSAPEAQRVVSVAVMSESSLVVDPLGRANGFKNGKFFAQTPGARVHMQDGAIVVTLPNVPDGVFSTTVATGAAATVSTTVTDMGEDPVTVTTEVEASGPSTTSRVELRKGSDKPLVRALAADETQKLSDAKFNSTSKIRATAKPTQGAAATTQTSRTTAPTKKNDVTAQPAATPRKSPSPAPTRR